MREMELWRDKLHLVRRGLIQDSVHCLIPHIFSAASAFALVVCFGQLTMREWFHYHLDRFVDGEVHARDRRDGRTTWIDRRSSCQGKTGAISMKEKA